MGTKISHSHAANIIDKKDKLSDLSQIADKICEVSGTVCKLYK